MQNKNWEKAIKETETVINIHTKRKLTLNGKNILINTLIIPKLLHPGKHIIFSKFHQNILIKKIFKFIWAPSKFEKIERKKLYLPKEKCGRAITEIKNKLISAKLSRISELTKLENIEQLWHEWSRYQLGSTMKLINEKLYSNALRNTSQPNPLYKIIRD